MNANAAIKALRLARKVVNHLYEGTLRGTQGRAYLSAALENIDETIVLIRKARR